ncbi:amidohydrolase family protein [Frondihabitans sp. PAMC 28766]|uniref:amidohydrolase family protein n=1 Tax=Frondihabitans sp. PAMC 28766 TaxID=1795630 RepID=UPI003516EBA2
MSGPTPATVAPIPTVSPSTPAPRASDSCFLRRRATRADEPRLDHRALGPHRGADDCASDPRRGRGRAARAHPARRRALVGARPARLRGREAHRAQLARRDPARSRQCAHAPAVHGHGVGRAAQYAGFDDWAQAFGPVYERPHDWAAEATTGAELSIQAGVTSIADVVTDLPAASALADAGLGGIAYWEVMDWENAAWASHGRTQVIDELTRIPPAPGVGLSPHAPYSLDVEPLLELPDIVRQRGLRLHLHLGESAFEGERAGSVGGDGRGGELGSGRDRALGGGPDRAFGGEPGSSEHHDDWRFVGVPSFRALRELGFGASATSFVDRLGVLGPDCHVAHGVYMTADDRALLRARGTPVALCPRSNAVIGLDPPPVADYLREGSAIAVGTDSLSSSPSLDPMADVTALHLIARSQGYGSPDLHSRLLSAATLGGAHALGLDTGPDRTGHLAVGARADLAIFDVDARTVPDAYAELVEDGAGRAVGTVIRGVVRALDGALSPYPALA